MRTLPVPVGQRAAEGLDTLLWSWHTDLLTREHSPGLWEREYQFRGPRSLWGRSEPSAFGAGAGGTGVIVSLVRSLHTCGLQEGTIFSGLSPLAKGQVWSQYNWHMLA